MIRTRIENGNNKDLAQEILHLGAQAWFDFLALPDLTALLQTCVLVNETLKLSYCWKQVAENASRRKGLVLFRNPAFKLPGETWYQFLRNSACRLTLRVSIFLPEILGYSLVHTQYPDYVKEFDIQPTEIGDQATFVPILQKNKASGQILCSFYNPYMVYWIVTSVLIRNAGAAEPTTLMTQKLMSMNAVTVPDHELQMKNFLTHPDATCITSPENSQNKIYFFTRRSNATVELCNPFAELKTIIPAH